MQNRKPGWYAFVWWDGAARRNSHNKILCGEKVFFIIENAELSAQEADAEWEKKSKMLFR